MELDADLELDRCTCEKCEDFDSLEELAERQRVNLTEIQCSGCENRFQFDFSNLRGRTTLVYCAECIIKLKESKD